MHKIVHKIQWDKFCGENCKLIMTSGFFKVTLH